MKRILSILFALVLLCSMSLVTALPAAALSGITVVNNPTTVSRPAAYTISFTTAAQLLSQVGTITITFPINTIVPLGSAAYNGYVKVNGTTCGDDKVTGDNVALTVVITVPTDIAVGPVTVVIDVEAEIQNPSTPATNWILTVKTSGEPTAVNSATYSTDAAVPPDITTVAGYTYQGNDTVVITFSEAVDPDDGTWSANEFGIKRGDTPLILTNAVFAINTNKTVLTVTLNEATDGDYLATSLAVKVTPASNAIVNLWSDAVPNTEKTGSVIGDTVSPTVALTYSLGRPVKDADTLTITATFSEAMALTPQIAVATPGDGDLTATAMTIGGTNKVWTYDFNVPSGSDENGTATVTITGTDLAGNANTAATNNTFVIDNTRPTVAPAGIAGTTIKGAGDTIVITFSEAVTAEDGAWAADEFTSIECGTTALTIANATFAIDTANTVLTITLDEATDLAYLVNTETIMLELAGGANGILDAALNEMLSGADIKIVGTTPVSGDVTAPTIINIVAVDADTIAITLSEAVVPADGTWSPNKFALIENPNGAPVNINNATVTANDNPGAGMATVLTIDLNAAIDGASLDVGQAVSITPAAAAVVDLAGNSLAAVEVSSGVATAPTIAGIVGTTIQGSGDTVVITFSEPVSTADGTWSVNEFDRIEAPDGTNLVLTNAVFAIDGTNTILTVTLNESTDGEYLVNGEAVSATPAASAIKDAEGNVVANTEVAGTAAVGGDIVLPTIDSIVGTVIPGSGAGQEDVIRIDFSEAVVPVGAWAGETQLGVTNADLTGATFAPAAGITTTLTITLDTGKDLVVGQTLTVTPVADKVLDLAGNAMAITAVASSQPVNDSYAIDLVAGWNLISLPLVPDSPAIATVLAALIGRDTVVMVDTFVYVNDALVEKRWDPPAIQELTTMVDGQGYWIEVSSAEMLVVAGSVQPAPPAAPKDYSLHVGWNLIGFKSLTAQTPNSYLAAIDGKFSLIYSYNAEVGYFEIINPATAAAFVPGQGYWIAMTEAGTIYP